MEGGGIDWVPALGVLVVGLVLGGALVWRMRLAGAAPAPPSGSLDLRDLQGQRDVLLRQLVELEDAAAKRTPEQLARERYALELETARVLKKIDELSSSSSVAIPSDVAAKPAAAAAGGAAETAAAPVAGSPALRGFVWGVGSVAAVAGLVFLVTQAARPREPGGSPTGELPAMGAAAGVAAPAPANDAEEARLRAAIERSPDDVDAHLALAHYYLGQQNFMGVWTETQLVLARAPGQPRALSYQALVRLAMGQVDVALEMLQQAIATDPDLIDAYVPLSLVLMRQGRTEEAERTMAEAKRRFPGQEEALTRFEQQMLTSVGDGPAPGEADPHAAVPPPGASPAAMPAARAAAMPPAGAAMPPAGSLPPGGAKSVSGRLDLDPALGGQIAGGVLFLIVRAAGVEVGPPLAVQRLVPTSFPLPFRIGEADSMTGDPLPDEVLVEARLDSDGDPTTRPPSDPRAHADGVRIGTTDLRLILRRGN